MIICNLQEHETDHTDYRIVQDSTLFSDPGYTVVVVRYVVLMYSGVPNYPTTPKDVYSTVSKALLNKHKSWKTNIT